MAATGLLGFNPYGKAVSLDISSKPVNLAIQLQQKEAAKKEALEKSFMDYEKSINPAGMRKVDGDVFLKKLAENKAFYLQNRDRILNPAKYGYDAQSQFMSNNKGLLSLIDQSKQAAANEKVVNQNVYQAMQQGKTLHDGLLQELDRQKLSVLDPNYKTVDAYALQFDKPHDEAVFNKNVWGNLKLPTREIPEKLPNGQVQYRKESYLSPEVAQTAVINAINEYKTSPNTAKHFNELMKDNSILTAANDIFGKTFKYIDPQTKKTVIPKIETPEQFVAGYALLKKPSGEVSTSRPDYPWLYKFNEQQAAADRRAGMYGGGENVSEGNLFDTLPDVVFPAGGGKITNGTALDKNGNPFNGEVYFKKEQLPAQIFSVIGAPAGKVGGFKVRFENGMPIELTNPRIGTITRQAMENYQLKYNTEPKKGRQPRFGKNEFIGVPNGGFN